MRLLGAVLAGGEARRFGSDKALALHDGRRLIDHVIAALAAQGDRVVVVGREWPGQPLIPDIPRPGLGPLGGVAGALAWAATAGFDAVLTAPCDALGLADDLVSRLAPGPAVAEGLPVVGLWPVTLAEPLRRHLAETEDRSMMGWVRLTGACCVDCGVIANVNTPADLAAARRIGRNLGPARTFKGRRRGGEDGRQMMVTTSLSNGKSRNGGDTGNALIAGAAGFGLGLLAAVGRRAVVQAPTAMAGDWDEGLKAEHKVAMKLFDLMEKTTEADTTKRAALLLQLQHALGKHAVQEEDVIYCALRSAGDAEAADDLVHDHGYVKQALYDLEKIEKSSPQWLERVREFRTDVETHVRREEDEIFPELKSRLSAEENKALTARMNLEGFKVA